MSVQEFLDNTPAQSLGTPVLMTLNNPYPGFQGHSIFDAEYFRNGTRYIVSMEY